MAGRAGRGPLGGAVYVQTRAPEHHAIQAAAHHSIDEFAVHELSLRTAPHPSYPPHVGLARFVATGTTESRAQHAATSASEWLTRANTERLGGALTVLGPAPCPITRLQGRWRWHVLVKAADRRALGRVMRAWRSLRGGDGPAAALADVTVDRDPVSLL